MDDLPKTTSGKIMRRLLQPTAHAAALPVQTEILSVNYPQLRAALDARAVLETGAVWLRFSRGSIPLGTSEAFYERLDAMLAQLRDGRTFVDRGAYLTANENYHTAVVDLLEQKGLATRIPSEQDRRVAFVEPTRAGRALVETIRRRRDAYLARRLRTFTAEERALLERAATLLERLIEDPGA